MEELMTNWPAWKGGGEVATASVGTPDSAPTWEIPTILFRAGIPEQNEVEGAQLSGFRVVFQRTDLQEGDLVIPRYSALPFYQELEQDVKNLGAKLLNTYSQHRYVADLKNWYQDFQNIGYNGSPITPHTWFSLHEIPENGPFVVKGETNSKKNMWSTCMFAENKKDAIDVASRLVTDSYLGDQEIYVRSFVPLAQFGLAIGGLPITEEYRFFVLNGKVMASGFYWSEHVDWLRDKHNFIPDPMRVPDGFIGTVLATVGQRIPFYVFDVGRLSNNDWVLIELNDGQMSGLCEIDPSVLYQNVGKELVR